MSKLAEIELPAESDGSGADLNTSLGARTNIDEDIITRDGLIPATVADSTINYLETIDIQRVTRNAQALAGVEAVISDEAPELLPYARGERYRDISSGTTEWTKFDRTPLTAEETEMAAAIALKSAGRQLPELSPEDLIETEAYQNALSAVANELSGAPSPVSSQNHDTEIPEAVRSLSPDKQELVLQYIAEGQYFSSEAGFQVEMELVQVATDQLGLYEGIFDVYNDLLQAQGRANIAYKRSTAETSRENEGILLEYSRQLDVAQQIIQTMDEVADLLVNIRFRRRLAELVDSGSVTVKDVTETGQEMNNRQEAAIRNDGTTDYLKAFSHNVGAPAVILEFTKEYNNLVRFWGEAQGREQFNAIGEMGKWFFIGRSSQEEWFGRDVIRHISATLGNSVEKVTRFTVPEGTQMAMSGLSRMTKILEGRLTQRRFGSDIQLYMLSHRREETEAGNTALVKQPYLDESNKAWRTVVSNNPTLSSFQRQMRQLRELVDANPEMDALVRNDLELRLDSLTDSVRDELQEDIVNNPELRRVRQFQYLEAVEVEQTRRYIRGEPLSSWDVHDELMNHAVTLQPRPANKSNRTSNAQSHSSVA